MNSEFNSFNYLTERLLEFEFLTEAGYFPVPAERISLNENAIKLLDKNPSMKKFWYDWYSRQTTILLQKLQARTKYGFHSIRVGGNTYRVLGDLNSDNYFIGDWIGSRGEYENYIKGSK